MIFDKPKKKFVFSEIKEKSIRTHYKSETKQKYYVEDKDSKDFNKPYLIFEPPEVLLQNIELKKVYENFNEHFGTLNVRVRKSTNLNYFMLGLIEGLKQFEPN